MCILLLFFFSTLPIRFNSSLSFSLSLSLPHLSWNSLVFFLCKKNSCFVLFAGSSAKNHTFNSIHLQKVKETERFRNRKWITWGRSHRLFFLYLKCMHRASASYSWWILCRLNQSMCVCVCVYCASDWFASLKKDCRGTSMNPVSWGWCCHCCCKWLYF